MHFTKHYFYIVIFISVVLSGCFTMKYSFSGASVHPDLKTFSVQNFPNRAKIVRPGLSEELVEALKDKILASSSLNLVTGYGDADFQGEIVTFETRNQQLQANNVVAESRFTIGIKVTYTNTADPDTEFSQNFTRYVDYEASLSFEDAQEQYTEQLIEELVEDIFNKAFVNW